MPTVSCNTSSCYHYYQKFQSSGYQIHIFHPYIRVINWIGKEGTMNRTLGQGHFYWILWFIDRIMVATYIAVFLLHEFEEGRHVGPSEVIHRFQAGEHRRPRQALEVVLANILYRKMKTWIVEWNQNSFRAHCRWYKIGPTIVESR